MALGISSLPDAKAFERVGRSSSKAGEESWFFPITYLSKEEWDAQWSEGVYSQADHRDPHWRL